MGHADYTNYALVENRGAAANYCEPVTAARVAAHRVVADYVLQFFTAQLKAGTLAFSEQDVRQDLADASAMLQHRAATAALIGYDEHKARSVLELSSGRIWPNWHVASSDFQLVTSGRCPFEPGRSPGHRAMIGA